MVTLVDLFTKSSFNKSALVLLVISVFRLLVNTTSAAALILASLVVAVLILLVKAISAAALILASLVKAVPPALTPAST